MIPLRYLIPALGVAMASAIVAQYAYSIMLKSEPRYGWEDAVKLAEALNAGRATLTFRAYLEERPLTLILTLDGKKYMLLLTRVLVFFEARGAPIYEERSPQLWGVWGNGTHAGAISFVDVTDDGASVTIKYVSLGSQSQASSICVVPSPEPSYYLISHQGGSVELGNGEYEWSGRRSVLIIKLRVVGCG